MKIFFDTVGCRLNQAEIEHMAGQFRAAGHEIIENAGDADLVIINTCAVTAAGASDSRQKARQANHAGAKEIIMTGCWATLEPKAAATLPGVSQVISNSDKYDILQRVLGSDVFPFDLEPIARRPLPGVHQRTRAFIKGQDGCNNLCTFCITRIARGACYSVPKSDVLRDILAAQNGLVHEVVLSGVHLGSWGRETDGGETITDLIQYLLDNSSVERIRLSSIEPWDLDDDFFDLFSNPRMCRHLHLPLQSGSGSVLKRMLRHTTPDKYAVLVEKARNSIPGLGVTTDIIVGFPGETESEFVESLQFVEQVRFSGGHVFKFSPRPGTAAARLPDRVHGLIAKERAEQMRVAIMQSEKHFLSEQIGKELDVLWESSSEFTPNGKWRLHGLSDNYAKVQAEADSNFRNCIDRVAITSTQDEYLNANIISI